MEKMDIYTGSVGVSFKEMIPAMPSIARFFELYLGQASIDRNIVFSVFLKFCFFVLKI